MILYTVWRIATDDIGQEAEREAADWLSKDSGGYVVEYSDRFEVCRAG